MLEMESFALSNIAITLSTMNKGVVWHLLVMISLIWMYQNFHGSYMMIWTQYD